jgi:DNA-directed RNA polymerase specialized sigma subunit
MDNKYCRECDKKNSCKKLCKKLEEHLAETVEVKRREEWLTEMEEDHLNTNKTWPSTLSSAEAIIRIYFIEHKSPKEIAKMLKVSRQYVSQVLKKYKPILKENIAKSL